MLYPKDTESLYPRRPEILDEYDWEKVKEKMDKDEDGDIWWNIRSHIHSTESIYNSTENLFLASLQEIS